LFIIVWRPTIIADGGIRNSGDGIKALACGANALMLGSIFAGTEETPAKTINFPKKGLVKCYRGMASREAQESWKGRATSIEGEMIYVPYKGRLQNVFEEFVSGMLSGMSYQNAKNIKQLQDHARFIKITSAGWKESLPHGTF
jgi:IMP dehydrogenase